MAIDDPQSGRRGGIDRRGDEPEQQIPDTASRDVLHSFRIICGERNIGRPGRCYGRGDYYVRSDS